MTISQQVRSILEHVPLTRSSDKELLVTYMQKSGMALTPKQIEIFKDMPSTETLRRIRQKIQEGGEFLATKEVEEARFNKYKQTKGSIGVANEAQTEELLDGTIVLPDGRRVLPYGN